MYLGDLVSEDFVLLQAGWNAGRSRSLLEQTRADHVIVHRRETTDGDFYYLYSRIDILDLLARADASTPIIRVLDLHEHTATPAMDALAPAPSDPARAVIIEGGRLVGFVDPRATTRGLESLPPTRRGVTRSVTRGATRGAAPDQHPIPRSVNADFPREVEMDAVASLLVSLTAEAGEGPSLPTALPTGSTIDVVVQSQKGFTLEGSGDGSLSVTTEEEPLPIQFRLRATELGTGRIRVLVFHEGQPLGAFTVAAEVVAAGRPTSIERASRSGEISEVRVSQPDLSLLILEQSGADPTFTVRLSAADPALELHLRPFGPIRLRMSALEYFQDFFLDIENLPLTTAQERAAIEPKLAAKGSHLLETLLPEELRVLLWSIRQRITTMRIESEEPWIPWELCKLQGVENGRIVEGPFLAEAFAVTRWIPGVALHPDLPMHKMAVIVPDDSGLPFAESEKQFMLSLANGGRRVESIPATYLDVHAALAAGEHNAWHFSGHGVFRDPNPNRSAMLLENQEELTPEDISGVVRNLGQADPLVFLNACQIGRSAMSLTDVGGWASQFLKAGAAAFVGAYWSVFDE
ncbi:MAG: CHAT domain-containing protein, partial [Acidimicrobiia bacterium]|nr:CHAT domain-containing protein [Acidimicrobiia bacterium]